MLPDCNWFEGNCGPEYFSKHLLQFKDKPVDFLQIGVFTGNASVWMLENVLTHPEATLTDVDTWLGSEEHGGVDFVAVEELYDSRVDGRTIKIKTDSDSFFKTNNKLYDFIYIDGDHTFDQVLKDARNGITALKEGGIIAFDDYGLHPIKEALSLMSKELTFIEKPIYHAWYKKSSSE